MISAPPTLRAHDLAVRYGEHEAVRGVTLEVRAGEIVCLLGGNGAGKTTVLQAFLGLVPAWRGTVEVLGGAVGADPVAARRRLAYLPEHPALYPAMTGIENLRYLAALGGAPPRDDAGWRLLFDQVGLPWADARRRLAGFSKGMRQKVAIAVTLARASEALLLDEPTSGLDPAAARELEVLVQRYAAGGGAVLMVTHDLFRARQTGHRIGIMRAGALRRVLVAAEVGHAELERIYLADGRAHGAVADEGRA